MNDAVDYIIVGAGSAGSVLAERLSANPRNQVLLLEEGGAPNWLSAMPKGFGKLLADPVRSHYYPVTHALQSRGPQETWIRGRGLGGSSAINGMVWVRGGQEDYDAIEAAGNAGWGWQDMLRCFREIEDHQLGASEFRGAGGRLPITTNPNRTPLADAFIAAGEATGLPHKDDQNGSRIDGVGYAQWNIDRSGRRVSAARAFLDAVRPRKNLTVRSNIRVTRVLMQGRRAVGVAATEGGNAVEFRARRAVVLCTGTIITPKLLQLSGIGDKALLSSLGIETIHHSPLVGRRLREHLTLALNFYLRGWEFCENREYSGLRLLKNVLLYAVAGKGPMARAAAEAIAFVRAVPESERADTQIMFNPYSRDFTVEGIGFEARPGMECYSYALRPQSEGSVEIVSSDAAAPPKVESNYLGTEQDRRVAIAGTRAIRHILAQPALEPFVIGETERTVSAQSDEDILGLYDQYGHSGYHAVGTAAMGPSELDVVDQRLRVRGVDGLYVADCSIFRDIPSGNTNAPAMAVGWRAAEIITEDAEH